MMLLRNSLKDGFFTLNTGNSSNIGVKNNVQHLIRQKIIFQKLSRKFSVTSTSANASNYDFSLLKSPKILVEDRILHKNILNMQRKAYAHGIHLRPHIKTHKSVDIAAMQMKEGAIGLTCSKVTEALTFIKDGFKDITIAYPIVQKDKAELLFNITKQISKHNNINVIVDCPLHAKVLSEAANASRFHINMLLKIDVGLHRIGIDVDEIPQQLPLILNEIKHCNHISFKGILSHAGNAYSAQSKEETLLIAEEEVKIMSEAKYSVAKLSGMLCRDLVCSVGCTPTEIVRNDYGEVNEMRPGNYVFMDLTSLNKGLISPSSLALTVLSQVVSENERYWIIDAGSKVLSSDQGAHGSSFEGGGYGKAFKLNEYIDFQNGTLEMNEQRSELNVTKLSEEHGWIAKPTFNNETSSNSNTNNCNDKNKNLKPGDFIRIIPNHSCVVANLANQFELVLPNGEQKSLPFSARGATA